MTDPAESSAKANAARDKPPRRKQSSGAAKRSKKHKEEISLIESGFRELLTFPAMPAAMAGDQWAADHFSQRGPALAKRLAVECERNDQLRKICLSAVKGQTVVMLGFELIMYLGLPAMHYGLVPGGEQFGVPVLRKPGRRAPFAEPEPEPETVEDSADDMGEASYWQQDGAEAPVEGRAGEPEVPAEPPPVEPI